MSFNGFLNLIGFFGKAREGPPVSGCATNTRVRETPASSQVNSEQILAHTCPSAPPPPYFFLVCVSAPLR